MSSQIQEASGLSNEVFDDVVSSYIYIDTLDSYLRVSDKQVLKPTALNRLHKLTHPGTSDQPKATSIFDSSPNKRVASGKGWLPIADDIIDLDGVRYANTYSGIKLKPISGDVSLWLELCKHIYRKYVDYVLDHWAFSIQYPLKKIRWQILVHGPARTGKSLTVRPLIKIWGSAGVSLAPDEVESGWGDGMVGRKFVCMEEVYMPDNKAFFNNLKTKLANDYIERLNVKSHGQVTQQNLYSMVLFTNHIDALQFNRDDDKLLVIESTKDRWSTERYKTLAESIDQGNLTSHIYNFLLTRDVSKFQYGALPVRTQAAERMAEESLPDYQRRVIEMIRESSPPFNKPYFTIGQLSEELHARGYKKFGDKGLSEVLNKEGVHRYRGQRKASGVISTTPTFWTVTDLKGKGSAELHDWYEVNK